MPVDLEGVVHLAPPRIRVGLGAFMNQLALRLHPLDPQDTILLVSSPRSGSTWVMNLLETLPGYRSVFEPVHPDWFRAPPRFLKQHPTAADVSEDPELRAFLLRILSGEVHGGYPDHRWSGTRFRRVLDARRLVVKSVRLARALPAIAAELPLRHGFHLVRHPCATIASQRRSGARGYGEPADQPLPPELVLSEVARSGASVDPDEVAPLLEAGGETAALAALWCLDNRAAQGLPGAGWSVVRYEDVVLRPEGALGDIFDALGEPVPEAARAELSRRSQTSLGQGPLDTDAFLAGWKRDLDASDVETVAEVLRLFDVGFYGLTATELVSGRPRGN